MKRLLSSPSLVYFVFYFGLLMILRWKLDITQVFFVMGGAVGMFFSWADRLAHVYFTRPNEQLSLQVKSLISQKRLKEAVLLLEHRKNEQRHLTVRSALFLMVWTVLAFFVITSTGSIFAVGFVMAIGLTVVRDMLNDMGQIERLKWWLFWQVKRTFSDSETKLFVILFMMIFCILSLMLV